MQIAVKLAFEEQAMVRLLNWLAQENAIILRQNAGLPLLYDSGVVYRREKRETWCDYLNMLLQGKEDCDGLSAARAGELIARGYKALAPGDPGYALAQKTRPDSIPAGVYLQTRSTRDTPGLYHCLTVYKVDGQLFTDDPSARLGMYGYIPQATQDRWRRAGLMKGSA